MSFLGNVLWFVFGGFIQWICWVLYGIIWCITIVGIPVGKQCFKFAKLSLSPFGKEVINGGSAGSVLLNILWLTFSGLELASVIFLNGILFCLTIVGIPFGKQCFKLAKLALMPFGSSIVDGNSIPKTRPQSEKSEHSIPSAAEPKKIDVDSKK